MKLLASSGLVREGWMSREQRIRVGPLGAVRESKPGSWSLKKPRKGTRTMQHSSNLGQDQGIGRHLSSRFRRVNLPQILRVRQKFPAGLSGWLALQRPNRKSRANDQLRERWECGLRRPGAGKLRGAFQWPGPRTLAPGRHGSKRFQKQAANAASSACHPVVRVMGPIGFECIPPASARARVVAKRHAQSCRDRGTP